MALDCNLRALEPGPLAEGSAGDLQAPALAHRALASPALRPAEDPPAPKTRDAHALALGSDTGGDNGTRVNTPIAALEREDPTSARALARAEAFALRLAAESHVLDPIAQPAAKSPMRAYLARLTSEKSRRTMRGALETVARLLTDGACTAETCPWASLRYPHTAALRAQLAERFAPATANKHLAALRGVLREAWRLDQIPSEAFRRAIDVEGVKAETLPAGRELSAGELRALAEICADGSARGARDAAVLGVLYVGGLRRAELVALELADYDAATGALTVRAGKGRKARRVYITHGGAQALSAWLTRRGPAPGAIFGPVRRGDHVAEKPMTDQAVLNILARLARAASVPMFSPHDLRRTFVSHLLDAGADLATVQQLAGHASVSTTARYERRSEATKQKAASLLHFPWSGTAHLRK